MGWIEEDEAVRMSYCGWVGGWMDGWVGGWVGGGTLAKREPESRGLCPRGV